MQSAVGVPMNVWTFALTAIAVALLCPHPTWVSGVPTPTNPDSNDTTFPLELQPPLIDDDADEDFNGKKRSSSIDSYGNPVDTLKPIETPDGRKVVSAQGLQFEIPNYASGITEIKKPADDLLPPFIDPIAVGETSTTDTDASTTVEIENAHIIELTTTPQAPQQQQQQESVLSSSILPASSSVVPAYLLELNDPDIGGATAYVPIDDGSALKVITWDLLPPYDIENQVITKENPMTKPVTNLLDPKTNNIKLSVSTQRTVNTEFNEPLNVGRVSVLNLRTGQDVAGTFTATAKSSTARGSERIMVSLDTTGSREGSKHESTADDKIRPRQENQSSSSTPAQQRTGSRGTTPTISTRVITTTTSRPTTVATTTHRPTTVATTTHRPTTVSTLAKLRSTTSISQKPVPSTISPATMIITTTTDPLDPSTFYKLAAGDSYTLPSWLADIDDPDLDAAVLYVVPDDIKEYNATIARDILPPLEPFVDLKEIHLPAPASETSTNTAHGLTFASSGGGGDTTATTTTTTTIRPTITRRPTTTTRGTFASTSRPHWIRAYPTTTTSTTTSTTTTTQKPTSFAFNLSSNPSTSNHNAPMHQSEISTTPTTFPNFGISTPTQQQQPHQHQTHHNHLKMQTPSQAHKPSFTLLNKNLTATAADQSSSTILDTTTPPSEKPFGQRNPFLPGFNDPAQVKPFHSASLSRYTTTTSTTTTTTPTPIRSTTPRTTTTTTIASTEPFEENPFDSSTIPAWLSGYEYDDIGPGVAFNYDPADSQNTVYNNLLPPRNLDAQAMDNIDPVQMSSSPASFLHHSFNPPQTTIHPSNVMLTHSLSNNNYNNNNNDNNNNNNNNYDDNEDGDDRSYPIYDSITEPPIVFVPPTIDENSAANQRHDHAKNTSTSFNQNFPAPFEPDTDLNAKTTNGDGGHEEPFPPLNGGNANVSNDSNVPIKMIFSKSDDGKVITNNIFLNAVAGSPSQAAAMKPFASNDDQKDFQAGSPDIISAPFSGFPTTVSGFTKTTPTRSSSSVSSTMNTTPGGRYTGRFGGAPGVLGSGKIGYAVQADGSIRDPDQTYRPSNAEVTAPLATSTQPMFVVFGNRVSESQEKKYHGTFGGPPGVLVPYDNNNKAAKP